MVRHCFKISLRCFHWDWGNSNSPLYWLIPVTSHVLMFLTANDCFNCSVDEWRWFATKWEGGATFFPAYPLFQLLCAEQLPAHDQFVRNTLQWYMNVPFEAPMYHKLLSSLKEGEWRWGHRTGLQDASKRDQIRKKKKLKCYGIAPSVINWIESYLRRRSFQVSVNGSLSQVTKAASGVPQGSVLGPYPFCHQHQRLSQ